MSDEVEEPASKQAKHMNTYPQAPAEYWPDAWRMVSDAKLVDPKLANRLDPNVSVTVRELKDIGICFWKMDYPSSYEYPVREVPWDPKGAKDPKLQALRDDRGYSYADIITIHPDHLPEYDKKIAMFFEEHIHDAEEIRYVLGGSGYFDVRSFNDDWIRIHVKAGDLLTLPEGIYHRFTCDEKNFIHAMRLFIGQPIWTPFNRPQEDHPSRKWYLDNFQNGQPSAGHNNISTGHDEQDDDDDDDYDDDYDDDGFGQEGKAGFEDEEQAPDEDDDEEEDD